jgi:hypothetical protein
VIQRRQQNDLLKKYQFEVRHIPRQNLLQAGQL